jgi:hypothetical protein
VSEIPVTCSCGNRFQVSESFKGGLVNCPQCGKAAAVSGGPEPLFWVLLAIGVAFVLGLSGLLWAGVGPLAGGIALGIGAAVVAVFVIAS